MTAVPLLDRVAGAPITWGVDDSVGWGHIMPADRVVDEMQEIGLRATELGPEGYLPTAPEELEQFLDARGLQLVGAFVPVCLYRRDRMDDSLAHARRAAATLVDRGAETFVLGPTAAHDGYDLEAEMTEEEWRVFQQGVERVREICGEMGLTTALHSHWGTAISRPWQIERVLEDSSVDICIDTGHMALAGADPLELARVAGDRVVHVHLKDVDERLAEEVRSGSRGFTQAVIDGLFRPLGQGFVDVEGMVRHLEARGYQGWYILEQDVCLSEEPAAGQGPVQNAKACLDYLTALDI